MTAVIVTGCPRSGTSIAGEVIALAGDAHYHFEPELLRRRGEPWLHDWAVTAATGRHVLKSPLAAQFAEAMLGHLPDLHLVWMDRDWRDVVASIWTAHPEKSFDECVSYPLGYAGLRAALGEHPRIWDQRLEDLIDMPCVTVTEYCRQFGWPLHQRALHKIMRRVSDDTSGYHAAGQDRHFTPHAKRIGRWRELPADQRARIEEYAWELPVMKPRL